jgi:hypothetical protein
VWFLEEFLPLLKTHAGVMCSIVVIDLLAYLNIKFTVKRLFSILCKIFWTLRRKPSETVLLYKKKKKTGHTRSGTWENHQMMSESYVVSILNFIDIQWSNIVPTSNDLFSKAHNPRAVWCVNFEPQRHLSVIFITPTWSNVSASNCHCHTTPEPSSVIIWTTETSVSHIHYSYLQQWIC